MLRVVTAVVENVTSTCSLVKYIDGVLQDPSVLLGPPLPPRHLHPWRAAPGAARPLFNCINVCLIVVIIKVK